MEKYYDDQGRVAVLYSPGYGAGWSTWNAGPKREALCMDRRIIEAVIEGDREKAAQIAQSLFPDEYVCVAGADQLQIKWIDRGCAFEVDDHDGNESVEYAARSWLIA